jgi:hypothetical protein
MHFTDCTFLRGSSFVFFVFFVVQSFDPRSPPDQNPRRLRAISQIAALNSRSGQMLSAARNG